MGSAILSKKQQDSDYSEIKVKPESITFTPGNWNQTQEFMFQGGGDDFKVQGVTYAKVAIQVDPLKTKDAGKSSYVGSEVVHVLGYKNCIGSDGSSIQEKVSKTTVAPGVIESPA